MTNSTNPLSKYFRQPQLYLRLPSNGKHYSEGSLELPITKELPIFAMTAKDELVLKTPDALLNGQATVDVIESCVPNIKNAWKIPVIDLDAILIAIRRATYGNRMDLVTLCPHCQRKNEKAINLEILSNKFQQLDFEEIMQVEGLEIYLRPQTYEQINKSNIEKFEQQRILKVVSDESLTEEQKIKQFSIVFNKLIDLSLGQILDSVVAIKMSDGTLVENRAFIVEFLQNCNKEIWNAIKAKLEEIAKTNPVAEIDLTCEHKDCAKDYKSPLTFEMSNFFE